jgi:hypothetical protein
MGKAQSKNVSRAVTNVSNYVSNNTTANVKQANNVFNSTEIKDCNIELSGDFNVSNTSKLVQTNRQIASAMQDVNLQNNIQQQMLQQAQSNVGFLGVGYASANNSTNQLVNSTTQITNDVTASADQYSFTKNRFECNRSTIIADNINIGFDTTSDLLSSQTLKNNQTAAVINKVSQKVDQRATATVEGIGGFLIAMLAIVALIVYACTKPLSSGGMKVAMVIITLFVAALVVLKMYKDQQPPFFSPPANCIYNSAIGVGTEDDNIECNNFSNGKVYLETPPTKYIYGIYPGATSPQGGNLVQMVISYISGQNKNNAGINGGYRVDTYKTLQTRLNSYNRYLSKVGLSESDALPNPLNVLTTNGMYYKIPKEYIGNTSSKTDSSSSCTPSIIQLDTTGAGADRIECKPGKRNPEYYNVGALGPNPTTSDPTMGIANLNKDGWETYLNKSHVNYKKRALFARFVLCDILGNFDLNIWASGDELVKFIDKNGNLVIDVAYSNGTIKYPEETYFFNPFSDINNWVDGMTSSGQLEGSIGVLMTNEYKFQQFMRGTGIFIILVIVLIVGIYMYYSKTNKKATINLPATNEDIQTMKQ